MTNEVTVMKRISHPFCIQLMSTFMAGAFGLTLVHFSAQHEPFLTQNTLKTPPDYP